MLYAFG